ncbi:Chondroitin sulfate proteoglycan 4 [Pseudolycoriella hygida]|uniref:Protein Wnt n=1 Tax=Pseudolycoriella hygida TaxID=35572 RepID=A0A9Q0NDT2_9DIPT|nr:Chondroitin sulfate proteoglycan 4 [Pseudolycoriella hygida]
MREIGDYLHEKYDEATQVKINKRGRLQVKDPRYKVPSALDLVYLDESPDWCRTNRQLQWPVSFFGASHIAMPLQEAKNSTNVRLRFRTNQENALLFLAAGRTDYCLVGLDTTRIKLLFKVDEFVAELSTPKKIAFNDLQWHDVSIQRYETNITLQIDQHFVRKTMPSRVNEFNVHFGVFLGGLGDFSETYLGSVDNYRGCISDVYYNNINVLKRAKERTSHVSSVNVAWICSPEFDADENQSISFLVDDAFVTLAKSPVQTGESWNLEFRTIEQTAIVLYNNGNDFVGLEIVDGKLRLLVGKGSNAVELIPERNVSDGIWHTVSISYSPTKVELKLDDSFQTASFANGSSQVIELDEEYFIGGLAAFKKKRALIKGLRAVEQSLRGCVRNLKIGGLKIGFPQMKITQGVSVECAWKYPCIEELPCISSSICQQYDVDDFICYCDQAYCIRADFSEKYKIFTRSDLPIEMAILSVSPLEMLEGDSAFLSTNCINVLVDYAKLHVMEAGVVFNIVQAPKHGKVIVMPFGTDDNSTIQNKFFSLIDLSTDKIKYAHNGEEQFSDHITIDLQLITSNREPLPDFLQGRHRFVLHVNITPVNDPPVLNLPPNRIFRLTQGIPKVIGPELFTAIDPDSVPSTLMYTILSKPESEGQHGQIELGGRIVSTFSQADVNQGLVSYLMNKQTSDDISYEIAIQVSDGMETSPAVFLPVSVLPLQLRMINNTGLVLVHKSFGIISPWNLSFVSNSDDDNVDVKYQIEQQPQFGNIQKLRTVDSSWITVESFTSDQILLGQIRYVHNVDFPVNDEFKFTASFGPIKTIKYDFRLTFTKLRIGIRNQNGLQIDGTQETTITAQNILHQTIPLPTFSRNIIYTVLVPPKYGLIYVDGHPNYAKEMDSFTQQDIDKNLIRYKTHHTCYSSFIDTFEFLVTVPECDDIKGNIKIVYNPPTVLMKMISYQTREVIQVNEGDRAGLSPLNFHVSFTPFSTLLFKVSLHPKHGALCNYDMKTSEIIEMDTFTLDNLISQDIYYCHDDSESVEDSINFLILSDDVSDFQLICEIQINITLINDNEPYCVSDNIFHVVRNESKLISTNDLKYVDPDINTNETNIVYKRLLTKNCEFYKDEVLTDHFTQDDVTHGRILLKHSEPDNGTASFVVTDGYYEVPGELFIQASEPFIKISERNASIVQEGKFILLKSTDLAIETNLNSKPEEIEYRVISEPSHGVIKILRRKFNGTMLPRINNITSVKNFTQHDIQRERLIYWNTGVASMDKIRYRVSTKGSWAEGEILIRIYPAAYWDLLQIHRNQTLYVEESTNVLISREILEIIHPNISPGDITYLVTTSPQHGYLEIQSITSDDEYNCKVFDQSTINSEKMFYIQAGVNQSTDHFIFDVTNGITWLKHLMLKIVIIPENLYMQTFNTTVEEGKILRLESKTMKPFSEYYFNKILEYKIIQHPFFGIVKSGKSKINRFTHKHLEGGQIHYVHDGSENSTDLIRFIAIARNKESVPYDLFINILPVNDEIPQIVTNTGLQMWVGGHTLIKKSDLTAQDYDTPPEKLTYIISHLSGGRIESNLHLNATITSFTQENINNDEIVFIHDSNHLNGQINFVITDGDHTSPEHVLHITTNPVSLEIVKNENLHVFPLTRKQILPEQLQFRCSDQDREVKFVITIGPQTGRILYEFLENGTTTEVKEFTQNDVNNGRILYEHTHSMIELKSNDSFYFDVTAKLANSLIDQIFNIEISVSSGGLLRFLPVPKLHLDEGDSSPIRLDLSKVLEYLETRAGIQFPELYIDSYPPKHGLIEMVDTRKNVSRFTLNDFTMGKVLYRHDHSDTIEDRILMSVFLMQGQIFLCNITIPVVINPINDHPFHLITQSPQMSIVEGENRTITDKELLTEDADTNASNIIYDIISAPTLGQLVKIADDGFAQDIFTYGNQFSQLDINDGRIQYVHYGLPQSTTFYFKVSDGKFKPAYEIFNIKVLPVTIGPGLENDVINVQQGSNLALIETKHLPIETNAHKNRLVYNITESPTNGYISVENKASFGFSYKQLIRQQVKYMQTNLNRSSDEFKL